MTLGSLSPSVKDCRGFAGAYSVTVFIPLGDDGPRRRAPYVTIALIGLNVGIFVVQELLPADAGVRLLYAGGAVPYEIAHFADLVDLPLHPPALVPPPLTIVSSMFLHGGAPHLLGNVWFLWIFGDNVEGALGHARFLAFYLVVGMVAAVTQVVMTPESRVPIVGASGAIAGVLGAYLVFFPRARVQMVLFLLLLVEVVVVPAFVALGAWFVWQVLAGRGESSVAIWAHVGGFLAGMSCGKLVARRRAPDVLPPRLSGPSWLPPPSAPASSSSPP